MPGQNNNTFLAIIANVFKNKNWTMYIIIMYIYWEHASCPAHKTLNLIVTKPSIPPSIESPGRISLLPGGVPVKIRSPVSKVIYFEI